MSARDSKGTCRVDLDDLGVPTSQAPFTRRIVRTTSTCPAARFTSRTRNPCSSAAHNPV